MKRLLLVGLLASLFPSLVVAQENRLPSAEEIIERLAPQPPRSGVRTRSLRNLQPTERRVDLNIQFEFDSAVILPTAQGTLEQLGLALGSARLASARFRIEGHTDAVGTAEYNLALSQRRAAAVVDYLTTRGIDRSRLESVGKGFSELANPDDPLASVNRRVRIYAMD